MKVTITGATGAIGQAFLQRLLADERMGSRVLQVQCITSSEAGEEFLHQRFPGIGVVQHRAWQGPGLEEVLRNTDLLVHLAWSSVPGTAALDPAGDLHANVTEAARLLDLAALGGVGRVVFVSSGGTVYGPMDRYPITEDQRPAPITAYGLSKLRFEETLFAHAKVHGYKALVLRPSNVYGMPMQTNKPQGVVQHWIKAILEGRPIELWNQGDTVRDLIHVDDMVQALMLAMDHAGTGTIFNIGSGIGTTLSSLADRLEAISGRKLEVVHRTGTPGAVDRNILSTERARKELGFEAGISLEEGLQRTWNLFRSQADPSA